MPSSPLSTIAPQHTHDPPAPENPISPHISADCQHLHNHGCESGVDPIEADRQTDRLRALFRADNILGHVSSGTAPTARPDVFSARLKFIRNFFMVGFGRLR